MTTVRGEDVTGKLMLIGNDSLGGPDRDLGLILMSSFLRILGDQANLPDYIILWNSAVQLARIDSPVLDHLKKLEQRGVKLISCRTCVEYFALEERMAAGQIEGMVRIIDLLSTNQVTTVA